MQTALYIAVGIGVLGLLILIHELGHFIFCKIFRVKVLKFSIGFGPSIIKKRIGETEYAIGILPFGGYVKPLRAEEIEAMLEDMKRAKGERISDAILVRTILGKLDVTESELEKRALDKKPYWQKMIIVGAGPFANLLSAFVFVWAMLVAGIEAIPPKVGKVLENSPAQKAGILQGDEIVEIDGIRTRRWFDVKVAVSLGDNEKVKVKLKREGKIIELEVEPERKNGVRFIGIAPVEETFLLKYTPVQALGIAGEEFLKMTRMVFLGFKHIFTSKEGVKSIGGPITITRVGAQAAERGLGDLFFVAFFLSINLAILNLIPIPLLDGGHMLFFTIEAIIRRRVSLRVKEAVTTLGLIILAFILLIAIHNDLKMIFRQQ